MDGDEDFKLIQDGISVSLVEMTRTAGLIANEDLAFYRSSNSKVTTSLQEQSHRLLAVARQLMECAVLRTQLTAPALRNAEAVEDNWRGIVDVVDGLLENADAALDEQSGVIKKPQLVDEIPVIRTTTFSSLSIRSQKLAKPQLLFDVPPDNRIDRVFKPLLKSKPHAKVPLEESIRAEKGNSKEYGHPYEAEIRAYQYPPFVHHMAEPISFTSFETTEAVFVDTVEGVQDMLRELKSAREIAIDLEHHDVHSYIGMVSLMQISTREKDWVVDTLQPWRHELQMLNEVFADPSILKVLHGAFMDMIWLQRDLGLYVVGLFDTYHASVALRYPRHGLAYLLEKFAGYQAEKKVYQMADWRIRPLPAEMFGYARSDTHFLLNIYDHMRNELLETTNETQSDGNLLESVLEESKKESLQRYEHPGYDSEHGTGANGWLTLVKTGRTFSSEQISVFRAIHRWRDALAREVDESVQFLVPRTVMLNITRDMPADKVTLAACFPSPPISVRHRLGELVTAIVTAKRDGINGPSMKQILRQYEMEGLQRAWPTRKTTTRPTAMASIAHVLQQHRASQVKVLQRAKTSEFWGSMVSEGKAQQTVLVQRARPILPLALPLPPLTAEVFTSVGVGDGVTSTEHAYTKERKETLANVFVVRGLGSKKRKAEESVELGKERLPTPEGDMDEIESITPSTAANAISADQATAAAKTQKKLHRALKKQTMAQAAEQESNDAANGRFDYSTAPSVLHATTPGRKDHKSFDPYKKSGKAAAGSKRREERPGKSFTFA